MIPVEYRQEIAAYTNARITKVVLNGGAYEITNFEVKAAAGGLLTLNYIIPYGSVASVTRLELKNDIGAVVSDNTVNIPITSDTLMLQTIEVKEGI